MKPINQILLSVLIFLLLISALVLGSPAACAAEGKPRTFTIVADDTLGNTSRSGGNAQGAPVTPDRTMSADCRQWYDPRWDETIRICGDAGFILGQNYPLLRLERWSLLDGTLGGHAYAMVSRIGSPDSVFVVQPDGKMGYWLGCETGPCRKRRVFSRK